MCSSCYSGVDGAFCLLPAGHTGLHDDLRTTLARGARDGIPVSEHPVSVLVGLFR